MAAAPSWNTNSSWPLSRGAGLRGVDGWGGEVEKLWGGWWEDGGAAGQADGNVWLFFSTREGWDSMGDGQHCVLISDFADFAGFSFSFFAREAGRLMRRPAQLSRIL